MADVPEEKNRLAGTNLENYGSPEHKALREKAAQGERAWDGVKGQSEPFLRIWRIEKFNVVDWPKEDYGTFFEGDSFICLNGYKNPEGDNLLFNVHFWLGSETTQDEAGTAAYKTVELDDLLGDLPVQHRETQGHESKLFRSLFPNGMKLLKGGVETGFRHVTPETYPKRLLQIVSDGKKKVHAHEITLDNTEINKTDCFILDLGSKMIHFRPEGASVWEKRAANAMVEQVFSLRNGRVEKVTIDETDETDDANEFWKTIGGKPDEIPEETPLKKQKVEQEKAHDDHVNKLYHVTTEDGKLKITESQSGKLDKSILAEEGDDVIIVDVGRKVWVWLGKTCDKNEQAESMIYAMNLLAKHGRPQWTPVTRITQGNEPAEFWSCFGTDKVSKDIC